MTTEDDDWLLAYESDRRDEMRTECAHNETEIHVYSDERGRPIRKRVCVDCGEVQ